MGDITLAALGFGIATVISRELVKRGLDLYCTHDAMKKCKKTMEEIKKDPEVTAASRFCSLFLFLSDFAVCFFLRAVLQFVFYSQRFCGFALKLLLLLSGKLMNKVDALKALVSTGQITFEQTLQSWKKMDSEWVQQLKGELFLLYEFEEKKKRAFEIKEDGSFTL
ncbi:hypothetical protein FRX31_013275 [Thalictrum thalictroides]|uniref:Uncharacterized protein n=1 Tax=Thalictrum thalictroides TaxID=46969 RepID=A0A7J6WJK0_THATH|nr:hypothetical protein FRX31_013275 [Thalictrum thalictroides]